MAVCGQNIFSRGARRGAKIFFARRGDGRIYHVDSHQEHGCFGTGKGGDADRDSTVDHCVLDRALWHVRRGEAAF